MKGRTFILTLFTLLSFFTTYAQGLDCQLTSATLRPLEPSETDTCCYQLTISNDLDAQLFTDIVVSTSAPTSIAYVNILTAPWQFSLSSQQAVFTIGGINHYVGIGTQQVATICFEDNPNPAYAVTIEFIGDNGATCVHTQELECEEPPSNDCIAVAADSIDCHTNTWCFKIQNLSEPNFIFEGIELFNVTGATINAPSVIPITPPLGPGETSDWICVNYTGANPGIVFVASLSGIEV